MTTITYVGSYCPTHSSYLMVTSTTYVCQSPAYMLCIDCKDVLSAILASYFCI